MALDRDTLCGALDAAAIDQIKARFAALTVNDASGETEQSAIAQFEKAVCQILQANTDAKAIIGKHFNPEAP